MTQLDAANPTISPVLMAAMVAAPTRSFTTILGSTVSEGEPT